MTHAQYKTRLCTCEHALSRTPTRGDTRNAYARSQPASQPANQPARNLSLSLVSFLLLLLLLLFFFRCTKERNYSGGYRIGDRAFFGDPNRPRSYRSLSISRPSPSPPPPPPGNSTKTTRFFPASTVPLRAPLSSCQRVRVSSCDDPFPAIISLPVSRQGGSGEVVGFDRSFLHSFDF